MTAAPTPRPRRAASRTLVAMLAVGLAGAGCRGSRPPVTLPAAMPPPPPEVAILAINDVYRIEGVDGRRNGGLDRLRTLRRRLEARHPGLLVLHAGDLLYPSLLSQRYDGAQMVDVLSRLDGDPERFDERLFVTFGNHELDLKRVEDLDRRVGESDFTWLDTNLEWGRRGDGRPLVEEPNLRREAIVEVGALRVGLFSLTTDISKPAYVSRFLDPTTTARAAVASLRDRGADLVVALTHLPVDEDVRLLAALGDAGPDLVLGGHDHQALEREVGGRWVLKGDADARSAVFVRVRPRPGAPPEVELERPRLDPSVEPDPEVRARIDEWLRRHDAELCAEQLHLPPGCLDQVFGHAAVDLVAEELEIRRCETNFGSWVADQALQALEPFGAEIAFVNAGGLRLNQDLEAGTEISLRQVGETFAYPAPLRLVRISGATLAAVLRRALDDWPGNGRFLQVAGFAFRADPATKTVGGLTLLTAEGPRPIRPEDELLAVVLDFLLAGGDHYEMLVGLPTISYPGEPFELRDLVIRGIQAAEPAGLAPRVEGRVCLEACDPDGRVGCRALSSPAGGG